ncbi:MAG TPA: DMT family transporter [Alphaproteobacteria bacterium]|nr:DMT family transporter [Alphaproteobacteria bacterium]
MIASLPPHHRGMIFAILGYTAFSFADVNAKWLTQDFSLYQLIVVQTALASVLLAGLSPILGGWKGIWVRREFPIHVARMVLNFLCMIVIVHSFTILSLASIYTMIFAKPFFAVLLAIVFYGEKVGIKRWAAIIAGFSGVLVILRPGFNDAGVDLLWPLAAAVIVAVMFVSARSLKECSPFVLGFYPIVGTCLIGLPFLLSGDHYTAPDIWQWGHFALGAALMSAGMTFISLAFRTADASVVTPFLYTEMIWGILFGYLLFGDVVDLWMIIGTAIIIASGLYVMRLKEDTA